MFQDLFAIVLSYQYGKVSIMKYFNIKGILSFTYKHITNLT